MFLGGKNNKQKTNNHFLTALAGQSSQGRTGTLPRYKRDKMPIYCVIVQKTAGLSQGRIPFVPGTVPVCAEHRPAQNFMLFGLFFRSFEEGLADRGGARRSLKFRPLFVPFSLSPLRRRGHILFVANPLPPTPFLRKSVMSIKVPPVILGPEMAAPILWAPGIFCSFCWKTPTPIKFLLLGGGGGVLGCFQKGGGKCQFYFYGREHFSDFRNL